MYFIRFAILFFLLALGLAACQRTPTAARPTPVPADTPTPAPTSTPVPTSTPAPTPTPFYTVSFHRMRFEYATTSDWTTLTLKNPAGVIAARTISVTGDPWRVELGVNWLSLNQDIALARGGSSIGMVVDIALAPDALNQPLVFQMQKGSLNASTLRVSYIVGNEMRILREIRHEGVVSFNPQINPLDFTIDPSAIKNSPTWQGTYARFTPQKMLWAFYYPWYKQTDWSSKELKDRPTTRYASDDPRAIARQIELAQGAGIDGFICSWWGPGSESDRNLKLLLDAARDRKFNIAIYFETLQDGKPRKVEEISQWLAYAVTTYRDHPALMKVNGKPLIVVWSSGSIPPMTWQNTFAKLRVQGLDATYLGMSYNAANLAFFDGIYNYHIYDIPNLVETFTVATRLTRNYPVLADVRTPKVFAATIEPGYDDRLVSGRRGAVKERDNGAFYRTTMDAALQSDPDWIFITSWNEWWENTHIEPSELYGEQYLQLTRDLAKRWKGK